MYESDEGVGYILISTIVRNVLSAPGLPTNRELLRKFIDYTVKCYPPAEVQQDCNSGSFLTVERKVLNLWEKYREQQDKKSIKDTSEDKDSLYTAKATKDAWKAPYVGKGLKTLHKAVLQAHENKSGNFFAIIQSSGMGKSRTVDELAKIMLTLPFNLRQTDPDNAYPPPDAAVRDYFSEFHTRMRRQIANRFLVFFAAVFQVMGDELKRLQNTDNLVKDWYDSLNDDINKNGTMHFREDFYRRAIVRAKDIAAQIQLATNEAVANSQDADMTEEYRGYATLCVADAVHRIVEASSHTDPKKPAILMYFDESHTLFDKKCLRSSDQQESREEEDTYFDALCSALNALEHLSVFSLFMSTNSSLYRYPPTKNRLPSHRDPDRDSNPQPPFTELGFDCHPLFPIKSDAQLTTKDISSVEFMCRFGRPLFWSIYEGVPQDSRQQVVIDLAKRKLIGTQEFFTPSAGYANSPATDENMEKEPQHLTTTTSDSQRLAVLGSCILLDFEPRRDSAIEAQNKLVVGHMRVAFLVPKHRQYSISGYPSELILAEAAAQLMQQLKQASRSIVGGNDRIARTLATYVEHGLITKGERGEVVARLLLTLALDTAQVKYAPVQNDPGFFSRALPLADFLKALVGQQHWENIKNSQPDNVPGGKSFKEAFKDAKVRFTHFNQAGDDTGCTQTAAFAAILRGMGIQCHATKEGIDIILPIFFDNEAGSRPLHEKHISGILISVKNREKASSRAMTAVYEEKIGFFSKLKANEEVHPYIAIVMELGVQQNSSSRGDASESDPDDDDEQGLEKGATAMDEEGPVAEEDEQDPDHVMTSAQMPAGSETPSSTTKQQGSDISSVAPQNKHLHLKSPTPSKLESSATATRASPRGTRGVIHPQYSIYIHRCSSTVYPELIKEKDIYASLLGSRKLFAEHPRQGSCFLRAMQGLKPVWVAGKPCYSWLENATLNQVDEDLAEGITVGSQVDDLTSTIQD